MSRVHDAEGETRRGGAVTLPGRRVLLAVASGAALVFVVFGVLATLPWHALRTVDTLGSTSGYHLALHSAAVRSVALVVTDLGSPVAVDVVAVLAVGCLLVLRRGRQAAVVALARLGELACESAAKVLVGRARPALTPPLTTATSASFPSGHTAGSVATYGAVALVAATVLARAAARWVLGATVVFVVAVGVSRVVLGVHFPTDVLGGMALGAAWVAVAFAVLEPGPGRAPDPRAVPPPEEPMRDDDSAEESSP
jgi:membrane-associated phospholipid phosphatase